MACELCKHEKAWVNNQGKRAHAGGVLCADQVTMTLSPRPGCKYPDWEVRSPKNDTFQAWAREHGTYGLCDGEKLWQFSARPGMQEQLAEALRTAYAHEPVVIA